MPCLVESKEKLSSTLVFVLESTLVEAVSLVVFSDFSFIDSLGRIETSVSFFSVIQQQGLQLLL